MKNNNISNTEMVTITKTEYETLRNNVDYYKKMYDFLCEQLSAAKRHRFGAKSEKAPEGVAEQLSLMFDEAELIQECSESEPESEPEVEDEVTTVSGYKRKRKGCNVVGEIPDSVEVEVVEHKPEEKDLVCPDCGEKMVEIGSESRRQLVIIPAQVKVREDIYYTYACKRCSAEVITTPIAKAAIPRAVIPGGFASPEAIAYLITQKFLMGEPIYRMEANFNRQGIKLSRQTMSNWMLKATELYLSPLYGLMKKQLLANDVIHADETTLQVLHEEGRLPSQISYMWLYRTGRYAERQIALYEYQPGRGHCYPKEFLKGYKGYIHTDGYPAYRSISDDIVVVGCLAHARRKFESALKSLPKGKSAMRTACQKGVAYCTKLFNLEKKFANYSPEQRYLARLESSKKILDDFFVWAKKLVVLPKSGLGIAVGYLLNQEPYLRNYLLDGRLEISNNRAERSIKGFVIGRKNFLFANTPRGAQGSAVMYSIVETAKENGLDPYKYLKYIFEKGQQLNMGNEEDVKALLPGNVPETCKVAAKF